MIKFYKKASQQPLVELAQAETGCWINISPPFNTDELRLLSEELDIPLDYFFDSLDINERSRYDQEDGVQFIVLNIPIKTESEQVGEAYYATLPLGIVEVESYIITIAAVHNPIIDTFLSNNYKNLNTTDHSRFALLVFERMVHYFLVYLRNINHQRNLYEKELYHSSRNEELFKLMNLQKSLVYFVTTLRDNETMLLRMQRTDFLNIRKREEEADFLEDIIIDLNQAQEMSRIYADILNATLDTFASIISNNLNTIMKRLTSITIILMVPNLIFSYYGMNFDHIWGLHYNHGPWVMLFFTIIVVVGLSWLFVRNRLF